MRAATLLLLIYASAALGYTPGTEHDYDVTGSIKVPGHGVVSFALAVALSVAPSESDEIAPGRPSSLEEAPAPAPPQRELGELEA